MISVFDVGVGCCLGPVSVEVSEYLMCETSQASHTHDAIAEAAQLMKEAVDDIMVTLNEAASEVGMVGGMVESIAEAMATVSVSHTACPTARPNKDRVCE